MAVISFIDMQWNGRELIVSFESKEILGKISDDLELILINRESKDSININSSTYAIRKTNNLSIDFSNISFKNIEGKKTVFDLYCKSKDKVCKICRKDAIKLDKPLRYMEPSYKLDNELELIPYYTIDDSIAVLVADSRTVAKGHCVTIDDKVSLSNFYVDNGAIFCAVNNFDAGVYENVYFIIKDISNKKEYNMDFTITKQNTSAVLEVDLSKVLFWSLGTTYDLYLETKIGQVIKSSKIGIFGAASNSVQKFYNEIRYDGEIFLWPYVTKDGSITIHAVDEQRIEKEKYILIEGKALIQDLNIRNNSLQVKFSREFEKEFSSPKAVKLIFRNPKVKGVVSINLDKDLVSSSSTFTLDLLTILNNDKMGVKGRWKAFLKFYFEDTIVMDKLVKDSLGVDSVQNRYTEPISYGNDLKGVVYITGLNELALLCTDLEGYTKEIYKIIEGNENIHECSVSNNSLRFKSKRNINKDLIRNVALIATERKIKKKHYMPVEYINVGNDTEFKVDFNEFINEYEELPSRWDFHIEFTYDSYIERKRIGDFRSMVLPTFKRYLNSFESKGINLFVPYFTSKNELSMIVQKESSIQNEKFKYNMLIQDFSMRKNIIKVKVQLQMSEEKDYKLQGAVLSFRSKVEKKEIPVIAIEKGVNGSKREIEIVIDINKCQLEQIFWDVYVVIDVNGEKVQLKVKNPTMAIKDKLDKKVFGNTYTIDNEFIVYPYITGNNSLALTYRNKGEFETEKHKLREVLAYGIYKMFKGYFDKKDIWLVYEKFSETAQDNSYYFFKYCYHNQPSKNVYYVIRKESPDYQNLKGMENKVLDFMSIKHLLNLCAAKILVSSESKTHGYAWRVQQGKIKQILDSKKHAFLQHGVTGLKKVDYVFNKKAKTAVDLFVVTSDYERKIIRENFGYNNDEIITTGFCRWDELVDKSNTIETKEIFLMPTWRNWLDEVSEEKFVSTPYFKNYMALLNSEKLHKILMEKNIKLNFYLHPKFKYYIDNFYANCENINIIQFGEQKVNELLMRTSLLITDYSSVAWDVYYQKKPVIFYQFDFEDYNAFQGSYMDMETELFGDRVFNADELIKTIEGYVDCNFEEKQEFSELRKDYFKYIDTNNSKRAFESIKSSKILKSSIKDSFREKNKLSRYRRIRENRLIYNLWQLAKKNKKTFEVAKKIKSIVRRLTIPV